MKRRAIVTGIALTLAFLSLGAPFTAPARADMDYNVKVLVDGKEVNFPDQGPFIDSRAGRTYVPLRFVSEALGGAVGWDQDSKTASVNKSGTTVLMPIGSKSPTVNGQARAIDAAAMLMNDRTVVPLRFVSQCLGASVEWDAVNRTVRITTPAPPKADVPPGHRVTSMGYVIPVETKLDIEDKRGDVNLQILIILPYGDLETQFRQAEDILASVHGRDTAKAAVDHARKKTVREYNLELKNFQEKISVFSYPNDVITVIQVWR